MRRAAPPTSGMLRRRRSPAPQSIQACRFQSSSSCRSSSPPRHSAPLISLCPPAAASLHRLHGAGGPAQDASQAPGPDGAGGLGAGLWRFAAGRRLPGERCRLRWRGGNAPMQRNRRLPGPLCRRPAAAARHLPPPATCRPCRPLTRARAWLRSRRPLTWASTSSTPLPSTETPNRRRWVLGACWVGAGRWLGGCWVGARRLPGTPGAAFAARAACELQPAAPSHGLGSPRGRRCAGGQRPVKHRRRPATHPCRRPGAAPRPLWCRATQVLGRGLAQLPRDQIVVATKVGRYGSDTFDFRCAARQPQAAHAASRAAAASPLPTLLPPLCARSPRPLSLAVPALPPTHAFPPDYHPLCRLRRLPLHPLRCSAQRVAASVRESLARLQLGYVDLIQCHDIEFTHLDQVGVQGARMCWAGRGGGREAEVGVQDARLCWAGRGGEVAGRRRRRQPARPSPAPAPACC